MPKLALSHITLENEPTLKDQEMTFDWKVPSDFGDGKEGVVGVDKISLNSSDRLNAGEEPRNALETVTETYSPPLIPSLKHILKLQRLKLWFWYKNRSIRQNGNLRKTLPIETHTLIYIINIL